MNDFERLQRGILDSTNSFWNARYIGRACYAPVTEDLRIKAELYSTHVAARYDALKLTAISSWRFAHGFHGWIEKTGAAL